MENMQHCHALDTKKDQNKIEQQNEPRFRLMSAVFIFHRKKASYKLCKLL